MQFTRCGGRVWQQTFEQNRKKGAYTVGVVDLLTMPGSYEMVLLNNATHSGEKLQVLGLGLSLLPWSSLSLLYFLKHGGIYA